MVGFNNPPHFSAFMQAVLEGYDPGKCVPVAKAENWSCLRRIKKQTNKITLDIEVKGIPRLQ